MVSKIDLLSDGEFAELVNNSSCTADLLRQLDYSVKGNSWAYNIVAERMKKLDITFGKKFHSKSAPVERTPIEQVCIENSNYNSTHLRLRLIEEGIKENKCEICGITDWQGKPLSMQLHHINGDHTDNRLENLQIICPNCHSQTDNFGSRNQNRKNIIKGDTLPLKDIELIMETVRNVGIVEARKQLPYRNSLINSIVKQHKDIYVLVTPKGEHFEFATSYQVSEFLHDKFNLGNGPRSLRSSVSRCASGIQSDIQGYKVYKKSLQ